MKNINRGPASVVLGDIWRKYAEPIDGVRMIGAYFPAHADPAGLAINNAGEYFAVHGRYITPLRKQKVLGAMAAMESMQADGENDGMD